MLCALKSCTKYEIKLGNELNRLPGNLFAFAQRKSFSPLIRMLLVAIVKRRRRRATTRSTRGIYSNCTFNKIRFELSLGVRNRPEISGNWKLCTSCTEHSVKIRFHFHPHSALYAFIASVKYCHYFRRKRELFCGGKNQPDCHLPYSSRAVAQFPNYLFKSINSTWSTFRAEIAEPASNKFQCRTATWRLEKPSFFCSPEASHDPHSPVCPYANMHALYPWNAFSNISRPTESNTFSCGAKCTAFGSVE